MPMSSSLLTPNENHAFNAFLSSVDYAYADAADGDPAAMVPPEWAMYNSELGIGGALHDVGVHVVPQMPQGKEALALAQATKNLMSLGSPSTSTSNTFQQPHHAPWPPNQLAGQASPQTNGFGYYAPPQRVTQDQIASTLGSPSPLFHRNPSEPGPSFQAPLAASAPKRSITEPGLSTVSNKRRRPSAASTATSAHSIANPPPRSASSKSASPPVASDAAKAPLLSPSQKKANHIQSEQKRRANIRQGYEALCETVPALREAIRAMEAEQAATAADFDEGAKQKGKRRRTKKTSDDGERIDGRAGPKSECVVLQKSTPGLLLLHESADMLMDQRPSYRLPARFIIGTGGVIRSSATRTVRACARTSRSTAAATVRRQRHAHPSAMGARMDWWCKPS
jgi:hypothetical protein